VLSDQLKARGESGVVSLDMLKKAFNARIVEDYLIRQTRQTLLLIFSVFVDLVMQSRMKYKRAKSFAFRSSVGKIFYSWSDWVHLVGVGLDRKRWSAARRYEVPLYFITAPLLHIRV
jgi:hypothetical protein